MFQAPPHVPRTFLSLQYVRAAACIVVIYGHGMQHLDVFQPGLLTSRWEASAVDIFFVLSGVVMWHMTAGETMSLYEYARRRFVRAIPFYWLVTASVAGLLFCAPWLFNGSRFDLAHIAASFFFVPWPHPVAAGQILPLIIPGWTFNYEIFFYALLGAALLAPGRSRAAWLIGGIVAVTALPLFIKNDAVAFRFYTQPIMLEFASGVFLGWLIWADRMPGKWWGAFGFLAGCAAVALLPSPVDLVPLVGDTSAMAWRVATYLVPSFAIVGGALAFDIGIGGMPRWPLAKLIGDASYSIYIVHAVVLAALTKLWILAGLSMRPAFNFVYLSLDALLCLGVGVACYFLLEKPLFRTMRNFGKSDGKSVSAPVAAVNQPA
jgi:exopolysaccharide production protein ExoZ